MTHTQNTRKLDAPIKAVGRTSVTETTYELLKRQAVEMRLSAYEHEEPQRSRILVSAESIKESARAVYLMVGMSAEREYTALPWREKRRLRKLGITQKMWEDELTESRLQTGRELVKQTLGERP